MSTGTDQIENDLEATRLKLSDTLDELGRKLTPRHLMSGAVGAAKGKVSHLTGAVGRQMRNNPLPTLLIAGGVAWLMMDRSRARKGWNASQRYGSLEEARWGTPRSADESDDAYDDRVHAAYGSSYGLKRGAQEALHHFRARISNAIGAAQDAASGMRQQMSAQGERLANGAMGAGRRAEGLYLDNPLAAGALAVAVGALLGGAAPLSDIERATLGDVADAASRAGAGLAEKGAQLAERAADAMH